MGFKIGIVGLGLIGGSLAKATKECTGNIVYGLDIDQKTMESALKEGTIDQILDRNMVSKMDLTILALRPGIAVKFVEENPEIKGILIDFCGVKTAVSDKILPLSKANGFTYIGGHPMSGKEVGGYENSKADLFKESSMILVPHENSVPKWVEEYFKGVGFETIIISDDITHDRIIAYTSQLAHIVSNAFVKSETASEHAGYSADSLKDLTRVATLDADMWTELFLINKENLSEEIDFLLEELRKYKNAIDSENEKELKKLLIEGVDKKKLMYP